MLLLLLAFIMRFVDLSIQNRPCTRTYEYHGTTTSHSSCSSSGNSSTSSSSSTKENNCNSNFINTLSQQQYNKLRYYQQLQQRQLLSLQCELLKRQKLQQETEHLTVASKQRPKMFGSIANRNGDLKGPKFRRGMTEFPSPNDSHNKHLPQLNHNNSSPQLQNIHSQPATTAYKRPLASPNTPCYGSYPYNQNSATNTTIQTANLHQQKQQLAASYSLLNEELTDECLKKNVQIVLNNLDRYNNALRSVILNEQFNNSLSFNNNLGPNTMVTTPESDYNSNATPSFAIGASVGLNSLGGVLNCSIASSHDFTHDNSDYQWVLDYGYRDGVSHQSVLSSLCESYNGIGELSYYDDMAKNIDANLAEVDMESFRAEDINSFLNQIPTLSLCQGEKNCREMDNSIYKSELLFSPVKESHISIDSLDMESYPEDGDIILTCKANKDNYTIAFEGSALYSDESFYAEPNDNSMKNKQNFINLHSNLDDIVKRKSLDVSMSRSDHAFTTWSKLKKSITSQLQRYPSGNNNTSVNLVKRHHLNYCNVRKSSSLPNLRLKKQQKSEQLQYQQQHQLNVSQALSNSTVDSCKLRNLLPMCHMPISTSSVASTGENCLNHDSTETTSSTNSTQLHHQQILKNSLQNQPAFNLVKLFIKQKSTSTETCMDVSSGCWPSSDGSSSSIEKERERERERERQRKKSMNDSGKSSGLSRHEEEEDFEKPDEDDSSFQLDSLDIICDKNESGSTTATNTPKKMRKDLYREVFESPKRRPLKNPHVAHITSNSNILNNNCSAEENYSDSSRTSENVTLISNRMRIPVDMLTKSIQTSTLMQNNRLRFVPPSFLAKLNKLGEEKKAPVYVIYPNYALPDLNFVQTSDVIFSPFNYIKQKSATQRTSSASVTFSSVEEEDEALKNVKYNQIKDWKSLVTLLPLKYRQKLKHIPEADVELDKDISLKPLFCMSPPIRGRVNGGKNCICDCAQYFQNTNVAGNTSSSGSSGQPPSSGYRGSSTLLSDSEFNMSSQETNMKNLYIYQYDTNRMESPDKQTILRTPKSILRKRQSSGSGGRYKRSSMYEQNESSKQMNFEKRLSLQEPYENVLVEDYLAEIQEQQLDNQQQYYEVRKSRRDRDLDARARAENFLSNVPKSELKYYAEIASILESNEQPSVKYDAAKLKNEVSRALSQKKVSFTESNGGGLGSNLHPRFTTPPNSPNISMAGGLRVAGATNNVIQRRMKQKKEELTAIEQEKLDKISSNRFKRLQIQWELLSKDSSMLLELASENETKSGGSTPTTTNNTLPKSRIPRPVSYPASKNKPTLKPKSLSDLRTTAMTADTKILQSPSRIVPPKRYSVPTSSPAASASPSSSSTPNGRARTPNSRTATPNSNTNTPKRRVQSPRTVKRTR